MLLRKCSLDVSLCLSACLATFLFSATSCISLFKFLLPETNEWLCLHVLLTKSQPSWAEKQFLWLLLLNNKLAVLKLMLSVNLSQIFKDIIPLFSGFSSCYWKNWHIDCSSFVNYLSFLLAWFKMFSSTLMFCICTWSAYICFIFIFSVISKYDDSFPSSMLEKF